MGVFGLFGNKEKKRREQINATRMQIINLINTIQMSSKDANATALLRAIQTEIQSQGETSEEKVLSLDAEIIQLLTEAHTYILKGQYPTAITKLHKAKNNAIDRHQYCMIGGRAAAGMPKVNMKELNSGYKKTRAEELQDQIDEKNAELTRLQQEFENLRDLYKANPNDMSIMAKANTVKLNITTTKKTLDALNVELASETSNAAIQEVVATTEALTKGRTYSEDQMEVARSQFQAQNEEMKATQAHSNANMDLLGQSVFGMSDPFAEESTANAFNPFADESVGTASASNQQQYGAFGASAVGTAEMKRDIEKAQQAIEKSMEAYNDKIEDANDELSDFNAELRTLLARRESASPSDCLVLDGQIDQVNAKRSNVVYRIKRYRQAVAELNDKASLLDKLSTQQDLAATNAQIGQLTGGKFNDFEGLAMFLNDSVKESNEKLEEISTAVSVSESEDIMFNSAAGASAALADATTTKDENKYEALKVELGMQR